MRPTLAGSSTASGTAQSTASGAAAPRMKVFTVGMAGTGSAESDNNKEKEAAQKADNEMKLALQLEAQEQAHQLEKAHQAGGVPPPAPARIVLAKRPHAATGSASLLRWTALLVFAFFCAILIAVVLNELAYNRARDERMFRLKWAELKHNLGWSPFDDAAQAASAQQPLSSVPIFVSPVKDSSQPIISFQQQGSDAGAGNDASQSLPQSNTDDGLSAGDPFALLRYLLQKMRQDGNDKDGEVRVSIVRLEPIGASIDESFGSKDNSGNSDNGNVMQPDRAWYDDGFGEVAMPAEVQRAMQQVSTSDDGFGALNDRLQNNPWWASSSRKQLPSDADVFDPSNSLFPSAPLQQRRIMDGPADLWTSHRHRGMALAPPNANAFDPFNSFGSSDSQLPSSSDNNNNNNNNNNVWQPFVQNTWQRPSVWYSASNDWNGGSPQSSSDNNDPFASASQSGSSASVIAPWRLSQPDWRDSALQQSQNSLFVDGNTDTDDKKPQAVLAIDPPAAETVNAQSSDEGDDKKSAIAHLPLREAAGEAAFQSAHNDDGSSVEVAPAASGKLSEVSSSQDASSLTDGDDVKTAVLHDDLIDPTRLVQIDDPTAYRLNDHRV